MSDSVRREVRGDIAPPSASEAKPLKQTVDYRPSEAHEVAEVMAPSAKSPVSLGDPTNRQTFLQLVRHYLETLDATEERNRKSQLLEEAIAEFPDDTGLALLLRACFERGILTREQVEICLYPEAHRVGARQVRRKLGEGGMGTVYLAYNPGPQRLEAVKFLSFDVTNPVAEERFRREMRIMGNLHHENLVGVHDGVIVEFRGGRHPCIVMEYLPGTQDCSHVLRRLATEGTMSVAKACGIAVQAAMGLGYAHTQGIVHRDVKPSNLLSQRVPEGGRMVTRIKVTDLGLARPAHMPDIAELPPHSLTIPLHDLPRSSPTSSRPITEAGRLVGTIHYMAPEQAQGEDISPKSDVYSLGCTLYQFLTNHTPFRGGSYEVLESHKRGIPPVRITTLNPAVPSGLERFVLERMMAHDPVNRPTMQEVEDTLRKYVEHPEGVSRGERWGAWWRMTVQPRLLRLISLLSLRRRSAKAAPETLPLGEWSRRLLAPVALTEVQVDEPFVLQQEPPPLAGPPEPLPRPAEQQRDGTSTLKLGEPLTIHIDTTEGQRRCLFTLETCLGTGSMGTVYLARDPEGKQVAVKAMRRDILSDAKACARFDREREVLRELRQGGHRLPVQEIAAGTIHRGPDISLPCLIMEYVPGGNLAQILRHRQITPLHALAITLQIAEGLQRVHEHGVVHRDIKPGNILLTREGEVKLADFGLVHLKDQPTITGENTIVLGTPGYASPEIISKRKADERSDLYSVGAVLYYLLERRPPFGQEAPMKVHARQLKTCPYLAEDLRRQELPDDQAERLDHIVRTLLDPDPAKRYPSANALASELRSLLEDMRR